MMYHSGDVPIAGQPSTVGTRALHALFFGTYREEATSL